MGLKQQPKCKNKTCRFCFDGKYCTILKEKPTVCRFYKERIDFNELAKENLEVTEGANL